MGWSSGFSIMELGGRASGMGGAFCAIADDGSALYYNPAGISFQDGLRIEADGFLVKGFFHFEPSSTPPGTIVPSGGYNGNVSPPFQLLANLFVSKTLSSKWTAGFGVFAPFGLGDNWTNFKDSDPANTKFVGRFAGTRGILQNIWAQPTIAYRLNPNTSVAIGPAVVFTHLLLEQSILNPRVDGVTFGQQVASQLLPGVPPAEAAASIGRLLPEGRSRFAGTAVAPALAGGFLWKSPKRKTNFGVSYKSPVTYHVRGWASFAFTQGTITPFLAALGAPSFSQLFPGQAIRAEFTTPGTLTVGVANSAFWGSTISFDFVFQNYSRFQDIPLNFTQTRGTATPAEVRFVFDFHDTYLLRAGLEKRLSPKTVVRGGYYFDHSAVRDANVSPLFPDSSKNVVTAGVSREMGNKEFSLFYQGAFQLTRTTNVAANANQFTNGQYLVNIHLFGFGMRLHAGSDHVESRN